LTTPEDTWRWVGVAKGAAAQRLYAVALVTRDEWHGDSYDMFFRNSNSCVCTVLVRAGIEVTADQFSYLRSYGFNLFGPVGFSGDCLALRSMPVPD